MKNLIMLLLMIIVLSSCLAAGRTARTNYKNAVYVKPYGGLVKPYTPFTDKAKINN